MKLLITTLFIISTINLISAQKISDKDSTAIIFKSKLLTISEYGIGQKDQILDDVKTQKAWFLDTKYENFVFIKVEFNQPHRLLNHSISTLNRDCSYYLAFNVVDSRFYRLGGFDTIDIDDFFKDLELREKTIFKDISSGKEIDGIDIYCLYDYYKLRKKKRSKKGFGCFENCRNKTKTKVIIN